MSARQVSEHLHVLRGVLEWSASGGLEGDHRGDRKLGDVGDLLAQGQPVKISSSFAIGGAITNRITEQPVKRERVSKRKHHAQDKSVRGKGTVLVPVCMPREDRDALHAFADRTQKAASEVVRRALALFYRSAPDVGVAVDDDAERVARRVVELLDARAGSTR